MRVLVTGATGFIGINVIHQLLKTEHEPVALVRQSSLNDPLPTAVETVEGNITDQESVQSALENIDVVIHLAAVRSGYTGTIEDWHQLDQSRLKKINVEGTENIIKAAEKAAVDKFVFASTILAHPDFRSSDHRAYVQSKIAADKLFTEQNHSFSYSILHPTYVVGPRDYRLSRLTPFWRVHSNITIFPPLYIPGRMNVVHVLDVADSAIKCLDESYNRRYMITGENLTNRSFHRHIKNATASSCVVLPIPYLFLNKVAAPIADWLNERNLFPISGEWYRKRNQESVPSEYEFNAPVEQRSTKQIIQDAYKWYQRVGVL